MVLKAGTHNSDSGPDFFNSLVKIGKTTWAGNVEIHVNSSDWFKHDHHSDPTYDSIILHVVFKNDATVFRKNNDPVPTLQLDGYFDQKIFLKYQSFIESDNWIPCENQLSVIDHFNKMAWLDRLMVERLKEKAGQIEAELGIIRRDFQEIFFRKLARSFGFNTNGVAFEHMAVSLPFTILAKHKTDVFQLESLLFGQAGMLNRAFKDKYPMKLKEEYLHLRGKYGLNPISIRNWKFMRMRPTNFPTIRISQFAHVIERSSGLLSSMLDSEKLTSVISFFQVSASTYWTDHYIFDKSSAPVIKQLGRTSIDIILINTVIPFLFVYAKNKNDTKLQDKAIDWLETIKPEKNVIVNKFHQLGINASNAMHSQALIRLKKKYCDHKLCLECSFGQQLLKTDDTVNES